MNAAPLSPEHDQNRFAIAAHFAGRLSPAAEAKMRAHLPVCAPCRRHYERHLTLACVDPRGLPAAQRIAAGLGFGFPKKRQSRLGSRSRSRWARWIAGLTLPVTVAAVFVLLVRERPFATRDVAGPFAARGARPPGTVTPSLWTYRIGANESPLLADGAIGASDELAFAYSNPTGKAYVMIFGVDEHRHVYWFHPAWPAGQKAPGAVHAAAGPGPHEVPDAIRHTIEGQHLDLVALFSDRALDPTALESRVQKSASADPVPTMGDGVVVVRRAFRVLP